MIKEGKIGPYEASGLIIITIITKVFLSSPRALADYVGTASWYTTIISALTAALGFGFIYFLINRFPGKDLVHILQLALGRLPGGIFSLALGGYLLFNAALISRELIEALKIFQYPLTPPDFILLFLGLGAFFPVYLGLESISRVAGLWFYLIIFGLLSLLLLAIPLYDVSNLFPILGYGIKRSVGHGIVRSSAYGEVVILALLINSLQGHGHFKRIGLYSIAISGALISFSLLCYTMFENYPVLKENTIPILSVAREIVYGRFFTRFEAVYIFVWTLSSAVAIAIYLYSTITIFSKVINVDDYRPLILPFFITYYSISMFIPDFSSLMLLVEWSREYGSLFLFGIPLIGFIFSLVRGIKGGG